jgi:hypothetical protein
LGWVFRQVARAGLLRGKTIGIDATTLEANAAMKSIVRRDTEESHTDYLKRLAESAGLEATDEAALRRMDRRRKKKGSNEEWVTEQSAGCSGAGQEMLATRLAQQLEIRRHLVRVLSPEWFWLTVPYLTARPNSTFIPNSQKRF